MSWRLSQRVVCDICQREGDVGMKRGRKPGAWICVSRKACSRRWMETLRRRSKGGVLDE